MTTPVKRRRRSAKRRPPRHSGSARKLAWLCAALGLGVAGGVCVAVTFALDVWGPLHGARAERAATPVQADATAAPGPLLEAATAADVPAAPETLPVDDEKPDSPAPVSAPAPDAENRPVPAPTLEPPPAAMVTAPERPRKGLSENELRLQLYRAPEVGLKPSVRDNLAEAYKTSYQSNAASARKPVFGPSTLVKLMPSAQQLPLRGFPVCQLSPDGAVTLGVHSRALHAYLDALAPKDATGKRGDPKLVRAALR